MEINTKNYEYKDTVDYSMLTKYVKFPLVWDEALFKYLLDSENNVVANLDIDLLAKIPLELVKKFEVNTERYSLLSGDFIDNETSESVGLVRGWGGLSSNKSISNPEEIQDNTAVYLLNLLNSIDEKK